MEYELDEELKENLVREQSESIRTTIKSLLNLNPSLDLFKTANPYALIPKTNFADLCVNTASERSLFVLTLLKDKCFQLYKEITLHYKPDQERALKLIEEGVDCEFFGFDLPIEVLWSAFCKLVADFTRTLVQTIRQLPGFDKFDTNDVSVLINEGLFGAYGLSVAKLFINGNFYVMIGDDIQMNHFSLTRILGSKATQKYSPITKNYTNLT